MARPPAWRTGAGNMRPVPCVEGGPPQAVGQRFPPFVRPAGMPFSFCLSLRLRRMGFGADCAPSRVAHWGWQHAACFLRGRRSAAGRWAAFPPLVRPAGMPFSFCLSLPFAPDGLWGGRRALPRGALGLASRWLAPCAEKRAGHGVPSSRCRAARAAPAVACHGCVAAAPSTGRAAWCGALPSADGGFACLSIFYTKGDHPMDPMLEKFFAEHEQNLQARRQQHREEVLRSLKLVKPCDGKKYYVDAETVRNAPPSQRAFFSVEEADGGQRYYFTSGSGTAPIDVTDEEFARLEALLEEEKRYTPAPPKDGAAKPTPRDEGSTTQRYEVAFDPAREGSIWRAFLKCSPGSPGWAAWRSLSPLPRSLAASTSGRSSPPRWALPSAAASASPPPWPFPCWTWPGNACPPAPAVCGKRNDAHRAMGTVCACPNAPLCLMDPMRSRIAPYLRAILFLCSGIPASGGGAGKLIAMPRIVKPFSSNGGILGKNWGKGLLGQHLGGLCMCRQARVRGRCRPHALIGLRQITG